MFLFYRLMGWVAFLCTQMSRYRVSGIPSHFWVIIACLAALGIGGDIQRRDAASYGKPPALMTIRQALAGGRLNQYVTVTGSLDVNTVLYGKENNYRTFYEALFDPETRQALLVKRAGSAPSASAVTGVLRRLPSNPGGSLENNDALLKKYKVSPAFELDEGDTPVNPRFYPVTALVAGIPLVLLLLSVAQKHIIFQPTPRQFGDARREQGHGARGDTSAPSMRLSGRLRLDPKMSRRFLEVPVTLAKTEGGKDAFVSKINVSSKQFHAGIPNSSGLWAAVVAGGSLRVESPGMLYLGRSIRPALRIRYTEVSAPQPFQAVSVLSFETEAERDAAQEVLQGFGDLREQFR